MAYTDEQVNLSLSFITSNGGYQTQHDPALTYEKIQKSLSLSPVTKNIYDNIVFGPAVLRKSHNEGNLDYDDYMFFIVESKVQPGCYKVAIRSTTSDLNAFEDIDVLQTSPWNTIDSVAPDDARISHGMMLATTDIIGMTSNNLPAEGKTLAGFFKDILESSAEPITITVCGHSMAGTLVPLIGLYLITELNSDRATVNVFSAAGTTAGNAAYAVYAKERLNSRLTRLANDKDVVTKAFSKQGLIELATLYEPDIVESIVFKSLAYLAAEFLGVYEYTHTASPQAFDTPINPAFPTYATQYPYQHGTAYLEHFNLKMVVLDEAPQTDEDIVIVSTH